MMWQHEVSLNVRPLTIGADQLSGGSASATMAIWADEIYCDAMGSASCEGRCGQAGQRMAWRFRDARK